MTTYEDDRFCRLSRKNGTLSNVRAVVDRHQVFWKESVAAYEMVDGEKGVRMDVVSHDGVQPGKYHYSSYNLTAGNLGPLDPAHNTNLEIRAFYASLSSFTLSFTLHDNIPPQQQQRQVAGGLLEVERGDFVRRPGRKPLSNGSEGANYRAVRGREFGGGEILDELVLPFYHYCIGHPYVPSSSLQPVKVDPKDIDHQATSPDRQVPLQQDPALPAAKA
eukprot:CAMPEP_0118652748 /NCGR_PEP_ID=MMETSP0785-20121206/11476_1 /TAXON_ID=91992 /ORGANISM="Bolidomonas pacifica, Strain CCMP 1866" /LENGTH=218 /DNA_ID=CAMNT_0006545271 /DNA_START=287 /DNA_END=942 /DNA_ORIENTATION=-